MPEQQRNTALHRYPQFVVFALLDEAPLVEAP
jgi:hypothetical protein